MEADLLFLVGVLCVSTLLNIAYLMPIPFRAFMRAQPEGTSTGVREAPLPCLVAIGVTSLGCLLLFLFPDPAINLLQLTFQGVGSR